MSEWTKCGCLIVVLIAPLVLPGLMGCDSDEEAENQFVINDGQQSNDGPSDNDPQQNAPQQNDPTNQNSVDPNNDDPSVWDDAHVEVLLDETDVALVNDYSDPLTVEVPQDVHSLAITITEGSPTPAYGVTDWSGPDGFSIVPDGWESSGTGICYQDCNNRVVVQPGAFGALAPNNPDSRVTPGTHEFRVFTMDMGGMSFLHDVSTAQSTNTVRVTVYGKMVDDIVPDTGTLDLNLFFTGANGWTAASAPDDPQLQELLVTMDQLYDQVGIEIGEVAYHDVDSSFQVIQDLQTGTGDLAQLFSESARATLEGPSVFFVEQLSSMFGAVLGISGGIPGPMLVNGSPRGGVAVTTDMSGIPDAPSIAQVTAHELGHYLGLFHTSEQLAFPGMPAHDPLPDTPPDDESYLMHAASSGDNMSEWQGRVMRKNPWVRH